MHLISQVECIKLDLLSQGEAWGLVSRSLNVMLAPKLRFPIPTITTKVYSNAPTPQEIYREQDIQGTQLHILRCFSESSTPGRFASQNMSQFFNSLGRNFGRNQNRKGDKKPPPIPTNNGQQAPPPPASAGWAPSTPATGRQTMRPLMLCQPFVKASLLKGSFKTIVMLPKYVDEGEWLALNVFEFFDYLNRFYGVISEFCTVKNCPSMSAGPGLDYSWLDANRQPTRLPAPTYIEYVMTWIHNRLNDESVFPTKAQPTTTATLITPSAHSPAGSGASTPGGAPGNWIGKDGGFPPAFFQTCKAIYKQMFRVFAHIYHTHFDKIVHLSLEAHWNSFFAHFINFAREFDLLEKRDMEPLKELIDTFDAQITANSANKASDR